MTSILARDPDRRCMAFKEWPERDRALWLQTVTSGDLLEPGGERAELAPHSNRTVVSGYGRFLAHLAKEGLLDSAVEPAKRITPVVVRGYLQSLVTVCMNSTATQQGRLEELFIAASAMDRTANWQWIRNLAAAVRKRHEPTRDKRAHIVGIDDLEELGLSLMRRAEEEPLSSCRRATLYRDGFIIALLIARPLRRTNFAGLQLGRHLVQRGKAWWIELSADETKNDAALKMPFPEDLVPSLIGYLAAYRPTLLAQRSRWSVVHPPDQALWVSYCGSAMGGQALYGLVKAHTRRAFGRSLSPHLFRDCLMTGLAIEDPSHVRAGAPLLGHKSLVTSERHYNQAGSVEAARAWHRTLARRRSSG